MHRVASYRTAFADVVPGASTAATRRGVNGIAIPAAIV
jgi:hypothetical protein